MNLSRFKRILHLVTILQSGSGLGADELAEEIGVSRRTLFRDLKLLEEAGIPCYFKRGEGHRISSCYFLAPPALEPVEAIGLVLLSKLASTHPELPAREHVVSAIRKVSSTLSEPIKEACLAISSHCSVHSTTAQAAAAANLPTLLQAIGERRVVSFRYLDPTSQRTTPYDLEPYHVRFVDFKPYLFGLSERHGRVKTFELTRIRDLRVGEDGFVPDESFDVTRHIGKAWRVVPEGQVYEVEVEFSASIAPRVRGPRWHPTQQQSELNDGGLRLRFEVDGLREIQQWLVTFGHHVRVLKPAQLAAMLVEDVDQRAVAQH